MVKRLEGGGDRAADSGRAVIAHFAAMRRSGVAVKRLTTVALPPYGAGIASRLEMLLPRMS